jgi:hypothetical protein
MSGVTSVSIVVWMDGPVGGLQRATHGNGGGQRPHDQPERKVPGAQDEADASVVAFISH